MAWHLATQVIEVLSTYRERSQMRQQHDYELLPRIGLNLKMVVNLSRRSYFQAGYGGHYNFMEINSINSADCSHLSIRCQHQGMVRPTGNFNDLLV